MCLVKCIISILILLIAELIGFFNSRYIGNAQRDNYVFIMRALILLKTF